MKKQKLSKICSDCMQFDIDVAAGGNACFFLQNKSEIKHTFDL